MSSEAARCGRALGVAALLLCNTLSNAALAAWGAHGMVASEHVLASQAGVEMLQRGGNAIDAAVATSFATGVVNPSSSGIGGGGFMLIYLTGQSRVVALDYRETAPAAVRRDVFVRDGRVVPALSRRGGLAVAVPGEVAGLALALQRYGTLSLADVMAPAIRYARDGFPVGWHLAAEIAANQDDLRSNPDLARTFLRTDGSVLQAADVLKQPALADTLERIVDQGPATFYHGDIAGDIVRHVQAAGGVLSAADLSSYRVHWRRPLRGAYGDNAIIAMPPPSSGGGVLLQILGILRQDDVPALEHNSPTYIHLLAEAMQHAFADRALFYGDPDFVPVPLPRLLAGTHTAALRRRINAAATLERSAYGSAASVTDHGTSHFSVMDAAGNAVACTTTINTAFGAMLVAAGTGILLNDEMDDFSAQPGIPNVYGLIGTEANSVGPRKRPLSSMTPTIVTRHGKAVLALGGSGGPLIISGAVQVLLNLLAFDLDTAAAVAAPRIHDQWVPPVLAVEPGIPPLTRQALARCGYTVKEMPAMGALQVVRRTADGFEGVADPRKGGEAIGW